MFEPAGARVFARGLLHLLTVLAALLDSHAVPLPTRFDVLAEGYVLKPAGAWDTSERGPRPVLKVKHPDFAEDARYNGARPFVPPPGGVTGVPAWLLAAAVERLTPPRVDAALSKLGPAADTAELGAEVVADLLADLDDDLGGLPEPDRQRLAAALTPAARTLASSQNH